MVFTSPPYFNLELYSAAGESHGEPSQSHVRFPTPSWWASQFLGKLIANAHACLKPGGHLLLNVCNNAMLRAGGLDLEEAVVGHALRVGFTHLVELSPLQMCKPRSAGSATASEPVYVFRKEPLRNGSAASSSMPPPFLQEEEGLQPTSGTEGVLEDLVGGW